MNCTQFRTHLLSRVTDLFDNSLPSNEIIFEIFEFQYRYNPIYQRYCNLVNKKPSGISIIEELPFLPIELFKSNIIKTGDWKEELVFSSSGTTAMKNERSSLFLRDSNFYKFICQRIFENTYGHSLKDYHFFGLLPSYLERNNSSLVYMVNHFIETAQGGFYLDDYDGLIKEVEECLMSGNKKPVIFGVSFALMDLVEKYQLNWSDVVVIETGGMKGRRTELTKDALHEILSKGFNVSDIHSEYGMTELISQAYSQSQGVFKLPESMRVVITDSSDPLSPVKEGKMGLMNIIDLAAFDTCSFIGTRDLGTYLGDGSFSVSGRIDYADVRGCNLMVADVFPE